MLHAAKSKQEIGISATYLGAHSVPKGISASDYTKSIIENQIPELKKLLSKGVISPENFDVFHGKCIFRNVK